MDKATVAKTAKLARLHLSEQEQEQYTKDLSGIFRWMEQLNEVNTDGVEPMVSVAPMKLPMREDKVTDGNCQEAVLANAPHADYGCFVVPKVVE